MSGALRDRTGPHPHGAGMAIFRNPPRAQVERLLRNAGLPSSDVSTLDLEAFFGRGAPESVEGIVGWELYGAAALPRSLAIAPARRSRGFGTALVRAAEHLARTSAVEEIYLLTTTAERLFETLEYSGCERDTAPEAIRGSRQFTALCPSSAVLMVKRDLPAGIPA